MPDTTNNPVPPEVSEQKAGQVIAPSTTQTTTQPPVPPAAPVEEAPPATPQTTPATPATPDSEQPPQDNQRSDTISWSASEYIEHEKNTSWYLMLGLVALLLAAVVFLITKDKISSGVVIFGALALAIYGARPPQQITFQLSDRGLTISNKYFPYEVFKSFAVVPEGGITSVVFVHHKRFAPLTTIYLAPDQEDAAINLLSTQLPMEEHRIDAIEHLMRRIRF